MGTVRLPIAGSLESRDGTLEKDARLKNCVVEVIEGKPWAVKRPGIGNASAPVSGPAQGMIYMNGMIYGVVNDVLFGAAANAPPPPQKDWVKVGDNNTTGITRRLNMYPIVAEGMLVIIDARYTLPSFAYTSTDGVNWTQTPLNIIGGNASDLGNAISNNIIFTTAIQKFGTVFVAHRKGFGRWTSTDLITWTRGPDPIYLINGQIYDSNYSFGAFIYSGLPPIHVNGGVLRTGGFERPANAYSDEHRDGYEFTTDGLTYNYVMTGYWEGGRVQAQNMPIDNTIVINFNGINFCYGYSQPRQVFRTDDGVTLIQEDSNFSDLALADGFKFIEFKGELLALTSDKIYASADGLSWAEKQYLSKYGAMGLPAIPFLFNGDLFASWFYYSDVWKLPASAGSGGPSVMTRPL